MLFTNFIIHIDVKTKNTVRNRVKKILKSCNLNFKENITLRGGLEWDVDFYVQEHDTVILCCEEIEDLWEKYMICQDLTMKSGYTCILAIGEFKVPLKILQLSALNGIVIVDSEGLENIPKIVRGEGVSVELNSKMNIVEHKTPRKIVLECEEKILDMLRNTPLTTEEILDALRGVYPHRTIRWCISKLKNSGRIIVLARIAGSGKAIYAVNPQQISIAMKKYQISKSWIRKIRCETIIKELRKAKEGISVREIAEGTGWKIPQIIAILRCLKDKGLIYEEEVDGRKLWKLKYKELN